MTARPVPVGPLLPVPATTHEPRSRRAQGPGMPDFSALLDRAEKGRTPTLRTVPREEVGADGTRRPVLPAVGHRRPAHAPAHPAAPGSPGTTETELATAAGLRPHGADALHVEPEPGVTAEVTDAAAAVPGATTDGTAPATAAAAGGTPAPGTTATAAPSAVPVGAPGAAGEVLAAAGPQSALTPGTGAPQAQPAAEPAALAAAALTTAATLTTAAAQAAEGAQTASAPVPAAAAGAAPATAPLAPPTPPGTAALPASVATATTAATTAAPTTTPAAAPAGTPGTVAAAGLPGTAAGDVSALGSAAPPVVAAAPAAPATAAPVPAPVPDGTTVVAVPVTGDGAAGTGSGTGGTPADGSGGGTTPLPAPAVVPPADATPLQASSPGSSAGTDALPPTADPARQDGAGVPVLPDLPATPAAVLPGALQPAQAGQAVQAVQAVQAAALQAVPTVPVLAPTGGAQTVSATPATLAPSVAALAQTLSRSGGTTKVVMRLDPPELGVVHVTLAMRQGEVQVQLVAGDLAAASVLDARRPEVRSALQAAGLALDGWDVSSSGGRERDREQRRPGGSRTPTAGGSWEREESSLGRAYRGVFL